MVMELQSDKKLIDKQLVIFKEMGFGGVVIHPRTGLDTEYLGDEYIELTKNQFKVYIY